MRRDVSERSRTTLMLLERYIGGTLIRASLLTLVVLLSLLVFFSFVEEMDDVGKGAYSISDALFVALLAAPRYSFEAFPIAALIGSLIGLGGLANHGELVAMRAAGFSLRRIVISVLKIGLLMMAVVVLVGEYVAPPAEQFGLRFKAVQQNQQITLKSRYGFWAKDGLAFVNIRRILPGARLEDISIFEFNEARDLKLVTYAKSAQHDGLNWVLRDIRQTSIGAERVDSRDVQQAVWDSLIDPGLLDVVVVRPTMLPLSGLHRYILFLRQNGQSASAYEVAFWTKIATPFATLVMLIIAVPFVFGNLRIVGIGQRIFAGVMLGTVFYFLSRGFSFASVVYDFTPWLAAGLPAMIFVVLGFALLRRAS